MPQNKGAAQSLEDKALLVFASLLPTTHYSVHPLGMSYSALSKVTKLIYNGARSGGRWQVLCSLSLHHEECFPQGKIKKQASAHPTQLNLTLTMTGRKSSLCKARHDEKDIGMVGALGSRLPSLGAHHCLALPLRPALAAELGGNHHLVPACLPIHFPANKPCLVILLL